MSIIESDWPADIELHIVSPLMYLKAQAAALGKITQGMIEAKVSTEEEKEDNNFTVHTMNIIASALEDAEVEILTVSHEIGLGSVDVLDAEGVKG